MSATSLDFCLLLVHHLGCILLSRGFGKFDSLLFLFFVSFLSFPLCGVVAFVWNHLSGVDDRP